MTHYLLLFFGLAAICTSLRMWYARHWWAMVFWAAVFVAIWWALFTHSQSGVWP